MPLLTKESLNDFFLPSQECIKPVEINRTNLDSVIKIDNGIHWEVSKDGTQTQLETASISLNDCLACSGCVTTAESVLIGLQSWSEVESTIKAAEKKVLVASTCPQSIASIAASYDLPIDSTFRKLQTLLRRFGFAQLLSTNIGREISLHESAEEFITRYKGQTSKAPLLASACPGWICYAEKQKSTLIPTISTVRSPQQMTGVMLKDVFSRNRAVDRGDIYHVAIMPCFDKKLEASRQEFQVEDVRDVDTVITSAEIVQMMRDSDIDFAHLEEAAQDESVPWTGRHPGSSSGGFLAHILVSAAHSLFGIDVSPDLQDPRIRVTHQKSPKLKEYELLGDDGSVLLRFAEAYGFRQITSLTQRLAPKVQRRSAKTVEYDYVEVMACESGCINGGGQVRAPKDVKHQDWVSRVEALYNEEAALPATRARYDEIVAWWADETGTNRVKGKMVTTYNEIPPMVNPLASKW